ncbi:vWA domain-containing protein [Acidicapsa acidisoli]|uniref:vWA domain-containing protein n=1 Tax=Acidicapsa acidisoli TaxID=1615681 RepID=UPI0021E08394|nr:VWA domain-containing protein [Acidicapsa acidisoli]
MAFAKGSKIASSMHPQIVVMLIDNSGSMAEEGKCEQVTEAVQDMVTSMQSMNLGGSGYRFLMNICAFGDSVRQMAIAASPREIDIDSLVFLGDDGATNMHFALEWAKDALQQSLERCRKEIRAFQEEKAPNPLCVLLSDGEFTGGDVMEPAKALQSISVKNGNVDVVSVGVGMEEQHFEVMRSIASRPEHAIQIDPGGIADFLSDVGSTIVDSTSVAQLVAKPR